MTKPITRLFRNPNAFNHGGTEQYEGLPVVPDNSDDLPVRGAVGLVATGFGYINAVTPSGATVMIHVKPGGENVPVVMDLTRIKADGTEATGIFALYRKLP